MAGEGVRFEGSECYGSAATELEISFTYNDTGKLVIFSDQMIKEMNVFKDLEVKPDFRRHMWEIAPVGYWEDPENIRNGMRRIYQQVLYIADAMGTSIYPSGWISDYDLLSVPYSNNEYKVLAETVLPSAVRTANGLGFQTHFGIRYFDDKVCQVIRQLQTIQPFLVALFANSYDKKTGHHSYRTHMWEGLMSMVFFDWSSADEYEAWIASLVGMGFVPKRARIHPRVRPTTQTIEFRMIDTQYLLSEACAALAINAAFADGLLNDEIQGILMHDQTFFKRNLDICASSGLDGIDNDNVVCPFDGQMTTMGNVLEKLITVVEPSMGSLQFVSEFGTISRMFDTRENGATRMKHWLDEGMDPARQTTTMLRNELSH